MFAILFESEVAKKSASARLARSWEEYARRMGQDGPRWPHLGTWMGPKRCRRKHMANLDGAPSDPGWDLDGPGSDHVRVLDAPPRDSNRLLGLSD